MGGEGRHRRIWQRIVTKGVNIILMRYWRFQGLRMIGLADGKHTNRWARLTRTFGMEVYTQHVCHWASTIMDDSRYPTTEELKPWIQEIHRQAVLFRLWSTTANVIRTRRQSEEHNDKPVMKLWPLMYISNADNKWIHRTAQWWDTQCLHLGIHKCIKQWYHAMRGQRPFSGNFFFEKCQSLDDSQRGAQATREQCP